MINFTCVEYKVPYRFDEEWKISPCSEGMSGSAFVAERGGERVIVKAFDCKTPLSMRAKVASAVYLAEECGIGPKLLHVDLKGGFLVIEYLEAIKGEGGVLPNGREDFLETGKKALLALKKIHVKGRFEPFTTIYERCEALDAEEKKLLEPALERARSIESRFKKWGAAPCHLDFHEKNIVESDGGLSIIDWDCFGEGNPYCDIAKFTHRLTEEEAALLFAHYLERKPTDEEREAFNAMRAVVYLSIATNQLKRGNREAGSASLSRFLEMTAP